MKRVFSCSSSPAAAQRWSKRDQKLLEAVERGDVGRVGALASRRAARPAKLNAAGQSALHLAAAEGLTECLTLLLAHGAPPDAQNDDASSGCASSVLLLCTHGAPLDVADAHGQTPLMLAARGNHAAVCAQLLQRGADPDLADGDEKTALDLAHEHGGTEAAAQLRHHGGRGRTRRAEHEQELARRRRRRKAEEEPTGPGGTRAPQEGAGRGAGVQELKERNGSLAGELARLRLERGRLREELRALREQDPQLGAAEEGGSRVVALCRALEAKREEAARLRRRLAGQRRELEALRDRLGRGVGEDEAGGPLPAAGVLRELQRRLEALARSQHEALQLVAEMEAEEAAGRGGRPGEEDGDVGEGLGGLSPAPGPRPGEPGEPEAPGGARELQERLEEARAEAGRWEAAATAERRAKEEAEAREAERELEVRELREKVRGLERTLGRLRAALRDREAKTKQLLAEAEALAAAVLAARSEGARLRLQLQE
ncbi:Ankyrin repeat domain-containing protein 35 [Aix galericulata]|nr:Ankyrin repeat domain-containing protein 35 [Aix galericulata]